MHGKQGHQGQIGTMGRAGQASLRPHGGNFQNAFHPAHIHDIWLDDIDGAHIDHALPMVQVPILFPACHIQGQGLCHLCGLFHFPIRAGFFKMADAIVFQHRAQFDRAGGGITGIGIDQQGCGLTQGLADCWHDFLAAPRPFILVMTAF